MRASWDLHEGDELAPGRTILRPLGGGSRYEVYLVRDERLRALVAAKVLRPAAALNGLAAESRHLRRLAHPMLLRAFDHVLEGERPHLVLEYVDGPRLSTLIRRYGVIVEQLLPLALNVCSVLHYLREEGVVHLDVKPANIVMAGDPKLIDLSVARTLDELASIDAPIGTAAYMAPEQADPARFGEIGPASDVYGLGATLYEALTRRRLHEVPVALERVYPKLAELVLGCVEDRPADRPTPAELGDALEPLVAELPPPRLGRFRPAPRA